MGIREWAALVVGAVVGLAAGMWFLNLVLPEGRWFDLIAGLGGVISGGLLASGASLAMRGDRTVRRRARGR